jgi:signal transduction histidine kinase
MKTVIITLALFLFLTNIAYSQQQNVIDSLQNLLTTAKEDTNKVLITLQLARQYNRINSSKQKEYLEQGLTIARKLKFLRGEGMLLSRLGSYHWSRGNYAEGIESATQALQIGETLKDSTLIMSAYSSLASNYTEGLKQQDIGIEYQKKGLKIAELLKDKRQIATLNNNIASTYAASGQNLDIAHQYIDNAIKIIKELKDNYALLVYLDTKAEIFEQQNLLDSAIFYFKQSQEVTFKVGDDYESVAYNAYHLGNIYTKQGKYAQAQKEFELAVEYGKKVNARETLKSTYLGFANFYDAQKQYDKAYPYLKLHLILKDSLINAEALQKITNAQLGYEKQIQAQLLEKEKQLAQEERRSYILGFSGGLLTLTVVLLLIVRNNRQRSKANRILQEKNEEIAQQSEELYQINEEVLAQRDNLQKSYENLELLNGIGKKITASLNFETIFSQLYQSVNQLMDATIFGIGIYKEQQQEIKYELAMEKGVAYLPYSRSMQDKTQWAVQCIEHRKEIFINDLTKEERKTTIIEEVKLEDGTVAEEPQSLIYLPLMKNQDKVFGLITVQSFRKNAYTDYQLNILRNLAIYTAIALENAESFHQIELKNAEINSQREELSATLENLQTTQDQLVQSERLAVVGKLVANVAHEINTPLGAIRASAGNIATDLKDSLTELPKIFEILSEDKKKLFFDLVSKALENKQLVSAKEERQIRKTQQTHLEQAQIKDADEIAYELSSMGLYEGYMEFVPLFQDVNSLFIVKTAYHLVNQQRSTDNIQIAVDRASKVVFALKTYARQDHLGEKVQANVKSGVETVLTIYHNLLKQHTEVVRIYEPVPEIWCYPDELNQVWTNLIHNALQAMSNKGKLTVGIGQDGGQVVVSFTDTGKGIPEEIKPKIFEPFFTTKPAGEGSGLGLDICQKIVKKHSGQMGFESEVGKGTTFWVRLPL